MADTLPNTTLTKNVWVDLYADTGIVAGTKINVRKISGGTIEFVAQAAEPASTPTGYRTLTPNEWEIENETGDAGAWARAKVEDAIINVKVA